MSSEEKTRITVDIFGTNYKLVGRSSVSYMKMVAAHVNDQMYHLSNALPQLESYKIAVLTSVNIADEFFKLRKELEQLQSESQKNLDLDGKYRKAVEQSHLLQLEIQGLQTEVQAAQQQHQAQQEYLQNVEQQLIKEHNGLAEQQRLQEENAELRKELEQERTRYSNRQSDDQDLIHEHKKLTIEYEKLKREYNEWIQLVMEKEDPS
jgi:cell division protein ZapA (FtsZ GTPase activity inhibitor)